MRAVKARKNYKSIQQYIEFLRHFSAYIFAEKYVQKKDILEIGCGNGYGSNHLSEYAKSVTAVDMSNKNISFCKDHYSKDNLRFTVTDGTNLLFNENSFDSVISFQVIEHIQLKSVTLYLDGIKKVVKDDGILILTTPNKKLRLLPFQKPWNKDHAIEYDKKSLEKLLSKHFTNFEIWGLIASEEIFEIESKRVKQSYWKVYLYYPIINLIKNFLSLFGITNISAKFRREHSKKRTNLKISEEQLKRFSINDFKIDKNCPETSLDLVAICRINK